ncbi:MAG: hypothetical protein ABIJ09_00495 [Pseudomonadota bacterium]
MSSSDTRPAVCPECGAAVPSGARVCPQCRIRLDDDPVTSRSDTVVESSMLQQLDSARGRQGVGPQARKANARQDPPKRTFERKYGAGTQRRRDEKARLEAKDDPMVDPGEPGRGSPAFSAASTDRVERQAQAARDLGADRMDADDVAVRPARRGLDRVERPAPVTRDLGADRLERKISSPREPALPAEPEFPAGVERDDRMDRERAPRRGEDRFEDRALPVAGDDSLDGVPLAGPAPRTVALVASELEDALEGGLRFGHDIDLADKLTLFSTVALVICTMLPWTGTQMGILVGAGPVWLLAAATVALVILRQRLRAHAAEGLLDGEEDPGSETARGDPAAVRRLNLLQIFTGVGAVAYLVVVALGIYLVDTKRFDIRFGWFVALFFAMGLSYSGIARFVRDAFHK